MALLAVLTFAPSPSADAQTVDLNLELTVTPSSTVPTAGTIDLDWDAIPGVSTYWIFHNADLFSPGSGMHADGTGFTYSATWYQLGGTWTVCVGSTCETVTVTTPAPADPVIEVTVNRVNNRNRSATVVVHDGEGNPLNNSTIIGHWENGASGSLYMALGPDGINTTPNKRVNRNANPTFVVDQVTYLDAAWNVIRYTP